MQHSAYHKYGRLSVGSSSPFRLVPHTVHLKCRCIPPHPPSEFQSCATADTTGTASDVVAKSQQSAFDSSYHGLSRVTDVIRRSSDLSICL
ncbi:hypothetical protein Rcae01_01040 [Novipirellula caenicola]|uniref:Uncharacterized protein n=1 Tax=Novipirellula caenicola TaxID=1536901 RepID=A0ABP9VMT1_9BACT